MNKTPDLMITAGQYYIECRMSAAAISRRLNIPEETLYNWKNENNWDEKRNNYLKSQYSTNQTLYELLHLIAKKAIEDFKEEGILPDQKTLYFIMNMSSKLPKLKQYERQEAQEKLDELNSPEEQNKITSDAMLQKFFDAVTGTES